jgi:glycosyltransferase involved in cell wall biosynthesis
VSKPRRAGTTPAAISILIVQRNFERRGVETRVLDVMGALDRDRFRVDVCALRGDRNEMDTRVENLGSTVHRMHSTSWRDAGCLKTVLATTRYDVVHFQDHYGHGPLLRVADELGVGRRVFQFHSTNFPDSPDLVDRVRKRIRHRPHRLRWIDRYATAIVACSIRVMDSRWKPGWRNDPRCRVIYNGVDVGPFRPPADRGGVRREFGLPEDGPLCIHIGRPSRVKNYPRCFDIFRTLCRRFASEGSPEPHLLLVGVDPRSAKGRDLQSLATRREIGGRTVFAGIRSDVPRLLKASDLMLLPSLFEGHPGTVIEACCAGTPVLTSILSGVEEIRSHLPEAPISSVSLAAADDEWAAAAGRLLELSVSEEARQQALHAVSESVFSIASHTRQLCDVWTGAGRGDTSR